MLNRTETPITAWTSLSLNQTQTVQNGQVAPVVSAYAGASIARVLGDENGTPLEIIPTVTMGAPMNPGPVIDQVALMAELKKPRVIDGEQTCYLDALGDMLAGLLA